MTETPLVQRLRGLIERLEKLEGPDREVDVEIARVVLQRSIGVGCYTASLDAAVALVERVLPGCEILLEDTHADFKQEHEARHTAEVMHDLQWVLDEGFPEPIYLTKGSGNSDSRPIALVIATLRALLSSGYPSRDLALRALSQEQSK